jgi:uncharacterized protein (TIGR02246 family)
MTSADLERPFREESAMRRVIAMVPLLCVMTLGVQFVTTALAQSKGGDEAAIRAVVANYVAARDRGDAAAVAAVFTEQADQLTSSGEWRRGRDELVRGTLASSKTNSGARTITIKTVRFPASDVAIADGEYVIGATSSAQARNMWTSFVLIRSGGRWRIDAIRNMLPAK